MRLLSSGREKPSQWGVVPEAKESWIDCARTRRALVCAAWLAVLACAFIVRARPQDSEPPDAAQQNQPNQEQQAPMPPLPAAPQQLASGALATLHGVVRNAVTGEGIPRALVRIEGDADTAALTDGDGRFAIPGAAVGPQAVSVLKPGFFDPSFGATSEPLNVLVALEMPDVEFTLAPVGAIRGRIDLSTGDPAENIGVVLLKRVVQDGRATWQQAATTTTRSDGAYRFGGLPDGQYEMYTTAAFDGEPVATLVAPGKQKAAARWGFASVAWPGARSLADAQVVSVAHGAEVQANFLLTREPFQAVSAEVALPQSAADKTRSNISILVMDGAGHALPYQAQFDGKTQTVQAALPQGSYLLLVVYADMKKIFDGSQPRGASVLEGTVDFAVADHAVTGLRVPLSAPLTPRIDVSVNRSGAESAPAADSAYTVTVTSASDGMGGGEMSLLASGTLKDPAEATSLEPGSYWVQTSIEGRGLCEASFTAGGANLGREPLVAGPSGVGVPLELRLRDDCAQVTLALPENLQEPGPGIEPVYVVYVVPDFDSTRALRPIVLRPSTSTNTTVPNLTPGNYHVYTRMGDWHLEYHNPAVMAALTGQAVTLAAGATETLTLEAPAQ